MCALCIMSGGEGVGRGEERQKQMLNNPYLRLSLHLKSIVVHNLKRRMKLAILIFNFNFSILYFISHRAIQIIMIFKLSI